MSTTSKLLVLDNGSFVVVKYDDNGLESGREIVARVVYATGSMRKAIGTAVRTELERKGVIEGPLPFPRNPGSEHVFKEGDPVIVLYGATFMGLRLHSGYGRILSLRIEHDAPSPFADCLAVQMDARATVNQRDVMQMVPRRFVHPWWPGLVAVFDDGSEFP